MKPFVVFLLASLALAEPVYFPVVGGSSSQSASIRLIGLGTRDTTCTATLGFEDWSGKVVGEAKVFHLKLGQSGRQTLKLSDLGLAAGERAEIRPVVDLESPLSVCWPAVEVSGTLGVPAFLSGTALRVKRPPDARLSPYIETKEHEGIRVAILRARAPEGPACHFLGGFRDGSGVPLGEPVTTRLAPGESFRMDHVPEKGQRILLDLRPIEDGSATGCVASAQVYDTRTGDTMRGLPLALPHATGRLDVPPASSAGEPAPEEPPSTARPAGQTITIRSPLGLPPVPIPADNPPTLETIALGRRLFYDTILSVDGTVACASCHDPAAGFSDPRTVSLGVNGLEGDRNSMSVLNAAFSPEVFWEGRSKGLEAQARMPVTGAKEFAHSLQGVERRLQDDGVYARLFAEAWGPGPITYDMAAKSMAAFQRTLLAGNSPLDRFMFGRDRNAISASAQRGLSLFQGLAGCVGCHSAESTNYATFGNDKFFNTGVAAVNYNTLSDQGRWEVTHVETDRGAFRPPSLRNIAWTAPYMHRGQIPVLSGVAFFYAGGGGNNAWLSGILRSIGPAPPGFVTQQVLDDVQEFFATLTGEMPENAGPPD